jgi:hypothetical protein
MRPLLLPRVVVIVVATVLAPKNAAVVFGHDAQLAQEDRTIPVEVEICESHQKPSSHSVSEPQAR